MSKSVVIVNIAYYQPGTKKMAHNYNHIRYIATKPEADRGDAESYRIGDDDYPIAGGTAAGHVKYAAERPGSSGLFGPKGEPVPDWKEVGRKLAKHNLPVWRVIVSLRQDDAERLNLVDREKWRVAIENGVNRAIKAMHLDPDHARWVAAFHRKEGHPHCHIVIWEEKHDAARRQGYLEPGERKGVFRSFAGEVFREERDRLMAEKTIIRDMLREMAGDNIAKAAGLMQEIEMARLEARALTGGRPRMLPVLRPEQEQELLQRLKDLARVMPGRGRIALAYMPQEVKAQAREIADWILRQPGFNQSMTRYRDLAKQIASHYTMKPKALEEAARKACEDIRDRIAQEVLRGAAFINRLEQEVELAEKKEAVVTRMETNRIAHTVWKAAWRALERERTRTEAQALLLAERDLERRKRREREEARERA